MFVETNGNKIKMLTKKFRSRSININVKKGKDVDIELSRYQCFCKMFFQYPEAYSEHCQTSNMECFAKIVNSFQPLTLVGERPILDV